MVHVLAAAFGLSAILAASALAFSAVKWVGAAYLIYLGVRAPLSAGSGFAIDANGRSRATAFSVYRQGFMIDVLNPKVAVFFMAFLPQFIDASAAFTVWMPYVVLGTTVNLMFSSADVVCVFLAGAVIGRLRRSSRAQRLMQRAGGAVLVGLGVHVALQKS